MAAKRMNSQSRSQRTLLLHRSSLRLTSLIASALLGMSGCAGHDDEVGLDDAVAGLDNSAQAVDLAVEDLTEPNEAIGYVLNGDSTTATHTVFWKGPGGLWCSGAMITPTAMLTARHCLKTGTAGDGSSIFQGQGTNFSTQFKMNIAGSSTINATARGWYETNAEICANDFAVLRLSQMSSPFTGTTLKVSVGSIAANTGVTLFGWGGNKPGIDPNTTQENPLGAGLLRRWTFSVDFSQTTVFTAPASGGQFGTGICKGDSGGPAVNSITVGGTTYQTARGMLNGTGFAALVDGCTKPQGDSVCWAKMSSDRLTSLLTHASKAALVCNPVAAGSTVYSCN